MTRKIQKYGWRPQLPDHRDHVLAMTLTILPKKVDLRALCAPVFDQGQLGSCTANAIAFAFEFDLMKQKKHVFRPARLFIYYNERVMEGTVGVDAGAEIRDGIKSINQLGVCSETSLPYNITKFKAKPSQKCYTEALQHKSVSYQSVPQTLQSIKAALAQNLPVVFGFTVYESFESEQVAKTGTLNMPAPSEKVLGGHAVALVGYDDSTQRFIVRNSWGPDWGQAGYFTMPYAYIENADLCQDFWTIQTVTG